MSSPATPLGQLRAIHPNELELILTWRNAPEVRNNMYTRHEISLAEHLTWWNRVQSSSQYRHFMFEQNTDPTGIVAFTDIDTVNCHASWAFYTKPKAPKLAGVSMEWLALEYAFNKLDLHKLYCEVLAFNESVIKLHQKFGFQVEGILREHHNISGDFVDIYCFGILKQEWQKKRVLMQDKLLKLARVSL